MPAPATLTGQDLWRGRRRLTALLNQVLTGSNVGITRTGYITLRVRALRGPVPGPIVGDIRQLAGRARIRHRSAASHDAAQHRSDGRTSGNAALATATTAPAVETREKEPSYLSCPSKPATLAP